MRQLAVKTWRQIGRNVKIELELVVECIRGLVGSRCFLVVQADKWLAFLRYEETGHCPLNLLECRQALRA
jgi:hypothetical protein